MSFLFVFAVILAAICILAGPSRGNVNPVEVTVYYETLCMGCLNFIPHALLPIYTEEKYNLTSLISKLTLVPYGWVHFDNKTQKYECQHGKEECNGNRWHGCAVKYIEDVETTVKYIACLDSEAVSTEDKIADSFKDKAYPTDACQDQLPNGLYQKINKCYHSKESWDIFKENGNKTYSFFNLTSSSDQYVSNNFQHKLQTGSSSRKNKVYYTDKRSTQMKINEDPFVPYVSFNDKRDDDLADSALEDFRKTLCNVTGAHEPACTAK